MTNNAYPPSYYAASATPLPERPALQGRVDCDVCILGAGYVGLSAALELAEAGYKVVILEAERIGWGASGRNGGQVIAGFACGEELLEKELGKADARRMFDMTVEGIAWIKSRMAKHGIDADWRDGHATTPIKPRQVQDVLNTIEHFHANYDHPVEWWDKTRLQEQLASEHYQGAMYDPVSGHLHPLKFALGLGKAALDAGVQIFEHSKVVQVVRGPKPVFKTAHGDVHASFGILAGNALLRGIAPEIENRIMSVGTYIAATEPLGEARAQALIRNDMAVADTNWALDYFRLSSDHRLLFGGRASYSTLEPPNLRWVMQQRMRKVFPQLRAAKFDYVWGGMIDISLNRAPHWGRLGGNLYFAQGFSGHGVIATHIAGRVIAEAIRGQSERLDLYAKIPHRPFPGGRALRTPLLVAAMAWYKMRDALG